MCLLVFALCVEQLRPFQQGRRRAKCFYSEAALRAELHCDALPADPKRSRMTLWSSFLPAFTSCRRVVVVNEANGQTTTAQRHDGLVSKLNKGARNQFRKTFPSPFCSATM